MRRGVVIHEYDQTLIQKAHGLGMEVSLSDQPIISFDRTLLLGQEIQVPWHLVPKGFGFLDQWEAAAPIWSYETLASDVARGKERERTEELIGDLRVPLYTHELLFLQRCDGAQRLLDAWIDECAGSNDRRLAFLRALYIVKPLFLALPRSWIVTQKTVKPDRRRDVGPMTKLIHVEIAPGRYACCRPEEAEMYRQRFAEQRGGRRC